MRGDGGDNAQLWKTGANQFSLLWPCGEYFHFKFVDVENLLASITIAKKAKLEMQVKLDNVEIHGGLDDMIAWPEGPDMVVANSDHGTEVAEIKVESLKRVLKRVKDGPVCDEGPSEYDD